MRQAEMGSVVAGVNDIRTSLNVMIFSNQFSHGLCLKVQAAPGGFMGRNVPIREWAMGPKGFSYELSDAALHRIAKTGQTYPRAKKQGRIWVVDEDAQFVGMIAQPEIPKNIPDKARALMEKTLHGRQTAQA
jgi:hypothetical protein